jgi:hypothetical protein
MWIDSRLRELAALGVLFTAVLALAACDDDDPKLKVTDIYVPGHGGDPIAQGETEGGTYVVIKGNRFIKDGPRNAKVYFGSRQGSIVRWQSDSELIVQSPGGKADEVVDVLVIFDPGGQLVIKKAFKFVDKDNAMPSVDDLNINKAPPKKK